MYKIMFVDDEEQNLFLMEKIIDWEEMGFRVCGIALDGEEGIQVFEETEPDVVFVDIRMEEMNGLELIERLQKEKKQAIYVIVTAYDEFSYAKKAISLGVKDYLLKPVSRKELIPMVQEIRQNLDEAKKKESETNFIHMQYESGIFSFAFSRLEESCLKKEAIAAAALPGLEGVIRGQRLWFCELFSPVEEIGCLMEATKDWEVKYRFPGYDHIDIVALEEKKTAVLAAFEALRKSSLKKKYNLQVNPCFQNVQEFIDGYQEGFKKRSYGFYEEAGGLYFSETVEENQVREYLRYGESGDEPLQKLLYNGSCGEMEKQVRRMADYAREKGSRPDGLIDEMIEVLFLVKSQLTAVYKDRAFMILRHRNIWNLHKVRTKARLLAKMEESLRETADAVQDMLEDKGNYSLMGKTAEYIQEHFSDPEFTAGEAAEAVHLSRNYFLKVFKEEMKISFVDYVAKIRMERAKKLLKDTDKTIYVISREVGYESQYHFSRKFKNMYKLSPNEYRSL